ncbi:MAG: histidine phosphatase family protein [Parvibaculaceae bacterium]
MLRLMLLRHAKSSWTDPGLDDHDRPLNPRGRRAAPRVGRFMRSRKLVPDLVLCSPARRARDTWKLASAALGAAPRLLMEEALYDFGNGGRILDTVRARAGAATSVLAVGHNPSIERLARRLAGKGDAKLRKRLAGKYPTGALAVISFDAADWDAVEDGKGTLAVFVRPRDLAGEPGS